MKQTIFFVSTNSYWGGSETLWSETALLLAEKGHTVKFAVRYKHPFIQKLQAKGASHVDLSSIDYPSLPEKILRKAKLKPHPFLAAIIKSKPQLVVISQGNNVDGKYYMTVCRQQGIPYVTLSQLVTDLLLTFIKDEDINELRACYGAARVNYFVSGANLAMHKTMIGEEHGNSKTVFNPFTVPVDVPEEFPAVINGQYNIALVGRLETYHKGHDLLIQVLQDPKWKGRPVTFNFYGTGKHQLLTERLIKMYGVTNIVFKGHVQDIATVWTTNHLLVLPSRMEGQSLALIEAMWCYRGAVVTDVGGAIELIKNGETGFIAPFPTVNAIDAALEEAWALRNEWEVIGRRAGKKVREIYKDDPIASFTTEIEKVFRDLTPT
jgi:glycosyltransferase involved in cell wall biosynthesis